MCKYNARRVTLFNAETNQFTICNTITEARKLTGCSYADLINCAATGQRYKKYLFTVSPNFKSNEGKHIIAIEKDGTQKEYISLRQFADSHYIAIPTVAKFLRNRPKRSVVYDVVKDLWEK